MNGHPGLFRLYWKHSGREKGVKGSPQNIVNRSSFIYRPHKWQQIIKTLASEFKKSERRIELD